MMDSTAIKQAVQEALKAAPELLNKASGIGAPFWQGALIGLIAGVIIGGVVFWKLRSSAIKTA